MAIFQNKRELLEWAKNQDDFPVMFSIWNADDVHTQARDMNEKLTDAEALQVLAAVDKNHDSSIGVNWETLSIGIEVIVSERTW